VYATDRDAGDNGKVEYYIIDDPSGFFIVNHYTGWVTVARPMAGVRRLSLCLYKRAFQPSGGGTGGQRGHLSPHFSEWGKPM